MNLLRNMKATIALTYASGTAVRNGAILDMQGFEGVVAVAHCATIAASAVGDIHWEQDTASSMGSAADLTGTAIAIAAGDSDQVFVSDLYKPAERYVRAVITKDTSNAQAESVMYYQYEAAKVPITNTVASTLTAETHVSPAEGTK